MRNRGGQDSEAVKGSMPGHTTPALPAPRRVDFRDVRRWVVTKVFGKSGYDRCYADNTPGFQTEFNTDNHRKYNAACYFNANPAENGGNVNAYERYFRTCFHPQSLPINITVIFE